MGEGRPGRDDLWDPHKVWTVGRELQLVQLLQLVLCCSIRGDPEDWV